MSFIIGAIKVVFLLGFLVLIHEGGHFIVAKLCKVKVKEFAIGFGPEIFSKQGKETKYSIRMIPLGGYVDMLGEIEDEQEEGSFSQANVSKRIAIVAAGAVVNIIFAVLVYFILMVTSGVNSSTIVEQIPAEYVDKQTVLQAGDEILMIDGQKTRVKSDIDNILFEADGENINVLVNRNGSNIELDVKPVAIEYKGKIRYILGIDVKAQDINFVNNVYYGFWETVGFVGSIGDSLKMLFTGNVGIDQMTGPVGISEMVVKTSGIYDFVYLLSLISLSLGVTNLLPIPALDGGKIVLLIIEAIRKKRIDEELELKIQSIGFTFLIVLSIYISFNDIVKIF